MRSPRRDRFLRVAGRGGLGAGGGGGEAPHGAVQFAGSGFLTVALNADLEVTGSDSLWFGGRFRIDDNSTDQFLMGVYDNAAGPGEEHYRLNYSSAANRFLVQLGNGGGTNVAVQANVAVVEGTWYNIAGGLDNPNDQIRCEVNGTAGTDTYGEDLDGAGTSPFRVGRSADGTQSLVGAADELYVIIGSFPDATFRAALRGATFSQLSGAQQAAVDHWWSLDEFASPWVDNPGSRDLSTSGSVTVIEGLLN